MSKVRVTYIHANISLKLSEVSFGNVTGSLQPRQCELLYALKELSQAFGFTVPYSVLGPKVLGRKYRDVTLRTLVSTTNNALCDLNMPVRIAAVTRLGYALVWVG